MCVTRATFAVIILQLTLPCDIPLFALFLIASHLIASLNRLLDQGFEKDLKTIISAMQKVPKQPWRRRTVLVSATINEQVKRLANISLKSPINLDSTQNKDTPKQSSGQGMR